MKLLEFIFTYDYFYDKFNLLSFWQNYAINLEFIYMKNISWKIIIKILSMKINVLKNINIYYIIIWRLMILLWFNLGYTGSIRKNFVIESILPFIIIIIIILIFTLFFLYFSYFPKKFGLYINLYIIILSVFFLTNNIIVFYITFELSIIPIFIIILGWGNQPERIIATNYLLIYTILFSVPLLIIILFIIININNYWWLINRKIILSNICWFIIVIPFLIKIPIYLFHLWLPKAHVEAPIIGRMFLARILLKTGSFGLIKINEITSKTINNYIISIFLILSIIARIICIIQSDIKKFVAYSRITHMTIIVCLVSTNSICSFNALIILILSHAIIRNIIFFITGHIRNNRKSRIIILQQNFINISPLLWFIIIITFFFNSSLPPSISMIREFIIFINSILIWNGNFFISLILFTLLIYYSIWFVIIFNLKKNNNNFNTWTLNSDILINLIHNVYYIILWININILI